MGFDGSWSAEGTSYSSVQTVLLQDVSFSHKAQRHRQTDGQTDDIMMPITIITLRAVRSAKRMLRLKCHSSVSVDVFLVHEEQPVRIRLTDVNDELPVFRNVPRPFLATVATNAPPGTSVYQLLAQDDDEDSVVRYSLESGRLQ